MDHHLSKVCDICNIIWMQCRCPAPKTPVKETCPSCISKGAKCNDMMTIDCIRSTIEQIKSIGSKDPEVAHKMEDDLYQAVLQAIREGKVTDPVAAAAVALEAKALSFPRWCA